MKALLLSASLAALAAPAGAGEIADTTVAKVLGTSGVTHTTKTQTRYGMRYADLRYNDDAGVIVFVRLGGAEQFELWKQAAAGETLPVPALGADAFQIKVFRSVCAKSLTSAACATPDLMRKTPKISDEQLIALVKAAL